MFDTHRKLLAKTTHITSAVRRYLNTSLSTPAEIGVLVLILLLCSLARVYFISVIWPLDGGFQSFAMLYPFNFGERPGADYIPYLGIGISYALYPLYYILGENFFAAIAAADLMTLAFFFASVATITILLRVPRACITLLTVFIILWAEVLCKLVYGFSGFEFVRSGNSLLLLRQGLPWLVFLSLMAWAIVVRHRSKGREEPSPAILSLPLFPSAVLAGLVPFWSNASGVATAIALIMTITLSACLTRSSGIKRATALALSFGLFSVTLAIALYVVTGGNVQDYINQKFNGVADYQYWYFAPFDKNYRIFTVSDLLRASVWSFGWTNLLGLLGMVLAVALVWRRHGAADLRTLGLIFILLAQFGTGMVAQLGGHISERYLIVFFSFGFIIGVVALTQILLPPLLARMRLPTSICFGVGRLVALAGLLVLVGAVGLRIHTDRSTHARVYYPPLGLYVIESHAEELAAFARLHDLPSITQESSKDRIFSGYLSPAEIGLNAEPATRYGANIHVLGDAARAEYMERLTSHSFPLVAQIAQLQGVENWHHWQLRANWYLYSYILTHYEPAFRTRFMAYYRPREEPLTTPTDLPNLTCSYSYPDDHQVELLIKDDAMPGAPHFGENWIFDAEVDYEATLTPRGFPEKLLPLVGSRGMIIVGDRSSGFMESIVEIYPAPFYLYRKEHGLLYGLPIGSQHQRLAIEHRFGSPSKILFTVEPANRGQISVEGCSVTPVLTSPFVEFEEHFPLTTEIDPRQRL